LRTGPAGKRKKKVGPKILSRRQKTPTSKRKKPLTAKTGEKVANFDGKGGLQTNRKPYGQKNNGRTRSRGKVTRRRGGLHVEKIRVRKQKRRTTKKL